MQKISITIELTVDSDQPIEALRAKATNVLRGLLDPVWIQQTVQGKLQAEITDFTAGIETEELSEVEGMMQHLLNAIIHQASEEGNLDALGKALGAEVAAEKPEHIKEGNVLPFAPKHSVH